MSSEGNNSGKELDKFAVSTVEYVVEKKLKERYVHSLESKFGIKRSKASEKKNGLLRIAASIVILMLCLFLINDNNSESQKWAMQFLKESKMMGNPDVIRKGKADVSDIRSAANLAYSKGDYKLTISLLSQIVNEESVNCLDNLYLGISYLFEKEAAQCIRLLNECKESSLSQEVKWYLALGYVMEDNPEAKRLLREIVDSKSYQYKKAQVLLAKIK